MENNLSFNIVKPAELYCYRIEYLGSLTKSICVTAMNMSAACAKVEAERFGAVMKCERIGEAL